MDVLSIQIDGASFHAPVIYVNASRYLLSSSNGLRHIYTCESINNEQKDQPHEPPVYIQAEGVVDFLLPHAIRVDGERVFLRRIGPVFTPENLSPKEVEHIFECFAERYDMTVALGLNAQVYRRMLIHLSELCPEHMHVLDFGVGTGTALAQSIRRVLPFRDSSAGASRSLTRRRRKIVPQIGALFPFEVTSDAFVAPGGSAGSAVSEQRGAEWNTVVGSFRDQRVKHIEISAVDISAAMVQKASACLSKGVLRIGVQDVLKCDYSSLPFSEHRFDGIMACFVVHYFSDESPFLEMLRVLKSGGWLAFNVHVPRSSAAKAPDVYTRSPASIQDYVGWLWSVGFHKVTCRSERVVFKNERGAREVRTVALVFASKP